MLTDPVYEGKSMAGLIGMVRAGEIPAGSRKHLWTPAVNNWGGAGRWAFLEVTDPWDAERLIREKLIRSGVAA